MMKQVTNLMSENNMQMQIPKLNNVREQNQNSAGKTGIYELKTKQKQQKKDNTSLHRTSEEQNYARQPTKIIN